MVKSKRQDNSKGNSQNSKTDIFLGKQQTAIEQESGVKWENYGVWLKSEHGEAPNPIDVSGMTKDETKPMQRGYVQLLKVNKSWGEPTITKVINKMFGDKSVSHTTVGTWLKEMKDNAKEMRLTEIEREKYEEQKKGLTDYYLNRLELIKRATFPIGKGSLEPGEKYHARRLQDVFRDSVDLFAQLSVIHEYALREKAGADTDDLDAMMSATPWLDEGKLFEAMTRLPKEIGGTTSPTITMLQIPTFMPGELERRYTDEIIIGATAQLGLPYLVEYMKDDGYHRYLPLKVQLVGEIKPGVLTRVDWKSGNVLDIVFQDMSVSREERKLWCDWRRLIIDRVPVIEGRRSDGVDHITNHVDPWKRFVRYGEDTSDWEWEENEAGDKVPKLPDTDLY